MIDLGQWVSGEFRIPAAEEPQAGGEDGQPAEESEE